LTPFVGQDLVGGQDERVATLVQPTLKVTGSLTLVKRDTA